MKLGLFTVLFGQMSLDEVITFFPSGRSIFILAFTLALGKS